MILMKALQWALDNGFSTADIARVYNNPIYTTTDPISPESERRVGEELFLTTAPNGVILFCGPASQIDRKTTDERPPLRIRRSSGGAGSLLPATWEELEHRLGELGYGVVPTSHGHRAVMNQDGTRLYVFPSTSSDCRGLANTVSGLRKIGIDVRRSK